MTTIQEIKKHTLMSKSCPKCGYGTNRYKLIYVGRPCEVKDLCTKCGETFETNGLFVYD